jgi:predicted transcriptional regulator of viral defense system
MRLIEIFYKLKALGQPILQTREVAALLKIKTSTASKILSRLAKHKHIIYLRRGLWGIPEQIDPLMLPEYLTAPLPSYISLQSALFYHAMISQIPNLIYAVSLARTKKFTTPLGTVSIHHIQPDFFFGFEAIGKHQIKMATPEKAIFDTLYLSIAKSKLFYPLPELELPKRFSIKKVNDMLQNIKSISKRNLLTKRFNKLISSSKFESF